jgi:hypothetical protein
MAAEKRILEYLKRAAEARRQAELAKNPTTKEGYLKLAEEWDRLAEGLKTNK